MNWCARTLLLLLSDPDERAPKERPRACGSSIASEIGRSQGSKVMAMCFEQSEMRTEWVKVQGPIKRVKRVESEETQDHVRESRR